MTRCSYFYGRLINGKKFSRFFLKIENARCCKCQAFITHNLFISLHIELVMDWARFGGERESTDAFMMNGFESLLFAQFLRSPAVRHSPASPCDIVIVCGRRREWKVNDGRRRMENLTPNSCQISRSVCVPVPFNLLSRLHSIPWSELDDQFEPVALPITLYAARHPSY